MTYAKRNSMIHVNSFLTHRKKTNDKMFEHRFKVATICHACVFVPRFEHMDMELNFDDI